MPNPNRRHRNLKRELVARLRDVPCMDCKQSYPSYVMEFDHTRGAKLFSIAKAVTQGYKALSEELLKCDVVCANCHLVRTYDKKQTQGS